MSIIAVCCGKGSPGATFVSVNLASAMTQAGTKTVLLDGDAHGGDVAGFLGLDPRKGLHPLKMLGSGYELESLQREVEERAGMQCIGGFPNPSPADADVLESILLSIADTNRKIIADLGRVDSRIGHLGRSSKLVVLVVRPDLVSVHGAERALQVLEHAGTSKSSIRLVVSGWDRRHPADVADIADALRIPILAMIPLDRRAARRALLSQRPLERGRAYKGFERLAAAVLLQLGVTEEQPEVLVR